MEDKICSTCKFWEPTKDEFTSSPEVDARRCEIDPCDVRDMKDDEAATICGHDGGVFYGPKYGCIHWIGKVKDDNTTNTETD